MKSKFNVDRGSCSTAQQGPDGVSDLEQSRPGHSWQFVDDVERLLGDNAEPDSLFFLESWTLGVPTAIENWQQRKQRHAGREDRRSERREPDSIEAPCFVQENVLYAKFLSSAHAAANAGWYSAGWSSEDPCTRTQDQGARESATFGEERDSNQDANHPMTQHRACQLLGATATSTQKQIKAAYRRKVSQWHPDRFESWTKEVRLLATEQMAAINEAYHVLRNGVL
jgi:hypothetical protein